MSLDLCQCPNCGNSHVLGDDGILINEGEEVKEINYGPVSNPDGTPTEFTRQMLEGTGRELNAPFSFTTEKEHEELHERLDRGFGPVTVITAEGTGQGYLQPDDSIEMVSDVLGPCGCRDYHMADCPLRTGGEDQHLEEDYEDRYGPDYDEEE